MLEISTSLAVSTKIVSVPVSLKSYHKIIIDVSSNILFDFKLQLKFSNYFIFMFFCLSIKITKTHLERFDFSLSENKLKF